MKLKYIIFDELNGSYNVPIIFPEFIDHHKIAFKFGGSTNVLGAGFVRFRGDGIVDCYGKSETLKKEARPEDERLIQKLNQ